MNAHFAITRELWAMFMHPSKTLSTNATSQSGMTGAGRVYVGQGPRPKGPVRQDEPIKPAGKSEPSREIVFQFDDESAKEVLLAGSFTDWDKEPIRMSRDDRGLWQATVRLPVGRHLYKFVVDGGWQDGPRASKHSPNSVDSGDSILEVF